MTIRAWFHSWCSAMASMSFAGLLLAACLGTAKPAPWGGPRDTPTNNHPADCENPELSKPAPGWRNIQPGDRSWNPVGELPTPWRAPRLKASRAAAMPMNTADAAREELTQLREAGQ